MKEHVSLGKLAIVMLPVPQGLEGAGAVVKQRGSFPLVLVGAKNSSISNAYCLQNQSLLSRQKLRTGFPSQKLGDRTFLYPFLPYDPFFSFQGWAMTDTYSSLTTLSPGSFSPPPLLSSYGMHM